MSNVSASPELDFWEFVNCGICHLEFVKENGSLSSVPFWLTECGHVVCNSHINPDHSCYECGSQGVQLMPLARELEPPMSQWFASAPLAFDAVGYALRFQMNMMANLLRYFKKKYMQYRPLYDRLKEEHAETKRLRKLVDELKSENLQLKQQIQMTIGDERMVQTNKRRRVDEDGHYSGHRTSSPRSTTSVPTPLGPDRLTLPPGHHQPQFNSRQSIQSYEPSVSQQQIIAQYAYVPPRSAQPQSMVGPVLTHAQTGPMRRAQAMEGASQDSRMMPPPALPSMSSRAADPRSALGQPATSSGLQQRSSILPPASASGSRRFIPQTPSKSSASISVATSSRPFVLATPQQKVQQPQRFLPSSAHPSVAIAGSRSTVMVGAGAVSQAPSRSPSIAVSGSAGQRAPFVPGTVR